MKKRKINLPTSDSHLGGGSLESKKKTLGGTEKKILIASSIAVLLTFIIGASYAYIAYTTRQKEINVLEADCINVTMEELTNEIRLKNAYPVTDEVGANTKPFRFKLTNTCGVGVDYNLNLEVMDTENKIDAKNIAVKVDENAKSILSSNQAATPTYKESDYTAIESYTTYSGSIKPYDSVTHEIRIWLDASAENDSQNGKFYSKVVIEARQNQVVTARLSNYIIENSEIDSSIQQFEHEATVQTTALTDYRYVGANPNNYVYFGCEGDTCTKENLYQIIGVIPTQSTIGGEYENRVKLMKATEYTESESGLLEKVKNVSSPSGYGYHINSSYNDVWSVSRPNQVLNGVYWKSLGEYQKYIATSVWYLGALNTAADSVVTSSPTSIYSQERGNVKSYNKGAISYVNYVGLMYASDYGYSLGESYSDSAINANAATYLTNSWFFALRNSTYEWTIVPGNKGSQANTHAVRNTGNIQYNCGYCTSTVYSIRPVFHLKENVLLESGEGTQEEPYRISIDE